VESHLLQMSENRFDSVVKLQQFTHCSLHVGDMHSLVDTSGFDHSHEGYILVLGSLVEDIDRLDSHLFQTRRVGVGSSESLVVGVVSGEGRLLEVVLEDVTIQPGRHGRGREETESTLVVTDLVEGRVRVNKVVSSILPFADLTDVAVRLARKPVTSSSSEENVGSIPVVAKSSVSREVQSSYD